MFGGTSWLCLPKLQQTIYKRGKHLNGNFDYKRNNTEISKGFSQTMYVYIIYCWRLCFGISSIRAAPYLSLKEHGQLITEGEGILIFEDNAEMEHYYKMTIGDDGPTESNPYDGIYRVYALCCDAEGKFIGENT